jgi:hypothetical protein
MSNLLTSIVCGLSFLLNAFFIYACWRAHVLYSPKPVKRKVPFDPRNCQPRPNVTPRHGLIWFFDVENLNQPECICLTSLATEFPLIYPLVTNDGRRQASPELKAFVEDLLVNGGHLAGWNPSGDIKALELCGVVIPRDRYIFLDRSVIGSGSPTVTGPSLASVCIANGLGKPSSHCVSETVALRNLASLNRAALGL